MSLTKKEKAIYDRASGVRSLFLVVLMFVAGGMAYQKLVSKAEAAETINSKQDERIEKLIEITQSLATQQAVTNKVTEANTKAIRANTEAVNELARNEVVSREKQERMLQRIIDNTE